MSRYTTIIQDREKNAYRVVSFKNPGQVVTEVKIQDGPRKEVGLNGCLVEDLLEICLAQLARYDSATGGDENKEAWLYIADALGALNARTDSRVARGVEGTSAV
jgi:hypothetical protein